MKRWWPILVVGGLYAASILLPLEFGRGDLVLPLVAALTGVFALSKDMIVGHICSPELKITFDPYDLRDCHRTEVRHEKGEVVGKPHYFRIRVKNEGRTRAENVEVILDEVKKFQDGCFQTDVSFTSLPLEWSHLQGWRRIMIPRGIFRYCDLGFILNRGGIGTKGEKMGENEPGLFWFATVLRPYAGRTSLLPGRYQFIVKAFGDNAGPVKRSIEIHWKGEWYEDFDRTISESCLFSNYTDS